MSCATLLSELEAYIREHRPAWRTERSEDGTTLRIADGGLESDGLAADGATGDGATGDTAEVSGGGPRFHVHATDEAVVIDWTWRLPLREGLFESLRDFLVAYVEEGIENHGWEVPLVLQGGPLEGRRLTKPREDLVGRLLFARKGSKANELQHADLYKWHLQQNDAGEYVCRYERSLEGEALDEFIARGVDRTGPFVLIHDK